MAGTSGSAAARKGAGIRDVMSQSRTHDWFSHNPAAVLRRSGQVAVADERSPPLASAVINVAPEGNLSRYLQEIRKFPMLSPEEELALSKRWRDHEDMEAAHKLDRKSVV